MYQEKQVELMKLLEGSVVLEGAQIKIIDPEKLRQEIEVLVKTAVLDENSTQPLPRLLPGAQGGRSSWSYPKFHP